MEDREKKEVIMIDDFEIEFVKLSKKEKDILIRKCIQGLKSKNLSDIYQATAAAEFVGRDKRVEEDYSGLKGKFECKHCGKKISSNFALLMPLHFIPSEDKVLCPDCLQNYIHEIEKCIRKE